MHIQCEAWKFGPANVAGFESQQPYTDNEGDMQSISGIRRHATLRPVPILQTPCHQGGAQRLLFHQVASNTMPTGMNQGRMTSGKTAISTILTGLAITGLGF